MSILSDIEVGDNIVVSRKIFNVREDNLGKGGFFVLEDSSGNMQTYTEEQLEFVGAYPLFSSKYYEGIVLCGSEVPLLPSGSIITKDQRYYEVCVGTVVDLTTYFSTDIWTFAEITATSEYELKELPDSED